MHDELKEGSETPNLKLLHEGKGIPLECGSGRSKGEAAANNLRGPHDAEVPAARLQPWSTIWCARCFWDQPFEKAMGLL